MQTYQSRVMDEKAELDGRIERLDAFLKSASGSKLEEDEHERMSAQLKAMVAYSNILGMRIGRFVVEPPEASP